MTARARRVGCAFVLGALSIASVVVGTAVPAAADEVVFRWADPGIVESSGMVVVDGRFVTVNDSGNGAELFVVDPGTGNTVDTIRWAPRQTDVEALAPGPTGSVWVGDVGDNRQERRRIIVTLVPLDGSPPEPYVLKYPGGTPRDAETLMAHPETGQLVLITKSPLGGDVYAAPARLRTDAPNELTAIGSINGFLTDGAFWPDGEHILVRGYGRAFLYDFPALELIGSMELPDQPQGEAIAVSPGGAIFVSSEGPRTPVWEVLLPEKLERGLDRAAVEPTAGPSVEASPVENSAAGPYGREGSWGGRNLALAIAVAGALGVVGVIAGRRWSSRGRGS